MRPIRQLALWLVLAAALVQQAAACTFNESRPSAPPNLCSGVCSEETMNMTACLPIRSGFCAQEPSLTSSPGCSSFRATVLLDKDTQWCEFPCVHELIEGIPAHFSMKLSIQPTAQVLIKVLPNPRFSVTPSIVSFTTAGWSTAQLVRINPLVDAVDQGLVTYRPDVHVTSADSRFNNTPTVLSPTTTPVAAVPGAIAFSIQDAFAAGISVTPSVAKAAEGSSAQFRVDLNAVPPLYNVTVTPVAPAGLPAGYLTFTPPFVSFTKGVELNSNSLAVSVGSNADLEPVRNLTISYRIALDGVTLARAVPSTQLQLSADPSPCKAGVSFPGCGFGSCNAFGNGTECALALASTCTAAFNTSSGTFSPGNEFCMPRPAYIAIGNLDKICLNQTATCEGRTIDPGTDIDLIIASIQDNLDIPLTATFDIAPVDGKPAPFAPFFVSRDVAFTTEGPGFPKLRFPNVTGLEADRTYRITISKLSSPSPLYNYDPFPSSLLLPYPALHVVAKGTLNGAASFNVPSPKTMTSGTALTITAEFFSLSGPPGVQLFLRRTVLGDRLTRVLPASETRVLTGNDLGTTFSVSLAEDTGGVIAPETTVIFVYSLVVDGQVVGEVGRHNVTLPPIIPTPGTSSSVLVLTQPPLLPSTKCPSADQPDVFRCAEEAAAKTIPDLAPSAIVSTVNESLLIPFGLSSPYETCTVTATLINAPVWATAVVSGSLSPNGTTSRLALTAAADGREATFDSSLRHTAHGAVAPSVTGAVLTTVQCPSGASTSLRTNITFVDPDVIATCIYKLPFPANLASSQFPLLPLSSVRASAASSAAAAAAGVVDIFVKASAALSATNPVTLYVRPTRIPSSHFSTNVSMSIGSSHTTQAPVSIVPTHLQWNAGDDTPRPVSISLRQNPFSTFPGYATNATLLLSSGLRPAGARPPAFVGAACEPSAALVIVTPIESYPAVIVSTSAVVFDLTQPVNPDALPVPTTKGFSISLSTAPRGMVALKIAIDLPNSATSPFFSLSTTVLQFSPQNYSSPAGVTVSVPASARSDFASGAAVPAGYTLRFSTIETITSATGQTSTEGLHYNPEDMVRQRRASGVYPLTASNATLLSAAIPAVSIDAVVSSAAAAAAPVPNSAKYPEDAFAVTVSFNGSVHGAAAGASVACAAVLDDASVSAFDAKGVSPTCLWDSPSVFRIRYTPAREEISALPTSVTIRAGSLKSTAASVLTTPKTTLPIAPRLQPAAPASATFSATGDAITVVFSQGPMVVSDTTSNCAALFLEAANSSTLGTAPSCRVIAPSASAPGSIRVSLGASASIRSARTNENTCAAASKGSFSDVSTLTLLVGAVRPSNSSVLSSVGCLPIAPPASPVAPSASLAAPELARACESIVFDARDSSGGGGRKLAFEWATLSSSPELPSGAKSTVANAVSTANSASASILKIPDNTLPAGTVLNVRVTVKSFLGASSEATASTRSVTTAVAVPTLLSPTSIRTRLSVPLALSASGLLAPACSASANSTQGTEVSLRWSADNTARLASPVLAQALDAARSTLALPAFSLQVGRIYAFNVTAFVPSSQFVTASTSTITVRIEPAEVVARVAGGTLRQVAPDAAVTLDARVTEDLDRTNTPLAFSWTCRQAAIPSGAKAPSSEPANACTTATGAALDPVAFGVGGWPAGVGSVPKLPSTAAETWANQTRATLAVLQFPAGTLRPATAYRFSVTATLPATSPVGAASGSTVVDILVAAPAVRVPTVGIASSTGARQVSPFEPVVLRATTGDKAYAYTWSVVSGPPPAASVGSYAAMFASAPQSSALVVRPSVLVPGSTYVFELTARDTTTGASGRAQASVVVNAPPSLGHLEVSPRVGIALSTSFTFEALLWTDDPAHMPLRYTFFHAPGTAAVDAAAADPSAFATQPRDDTTPALSALVQLATTSLLPRVSRTLPLGTGANRTRSVVVRVTDSLDASALSTSDASGKPVLLSVRLLPSSGSGSGDAGAVTAGAVPAGGQTSAVSTVAPRAEIAANATTTLQAATSAGSARADEAAALAASIAEVIAPPCARVDCGAFGACVEGVCQCTAGYSGERCEVPPVINGGLSPWTPWSPCDATCGTGTQRRQKTCTNPVPGPGGAPCPTGVGVDKETRACAASACPVGTPSVDGRFGPWSDWGECVVSCAGSLGGTRVGKQTRSRACDSPAPANGGAACLGEATDSRACVAECTAVEKQCAGVGLLANGTVVRECSGHGVCQRSAKPCPSQSSSCVAVCACAAGWSGEACDTTVQQAIEQRRVLGKLIASIGTQLEAEKLSSDNGAGAGSASLLDAIAHVSSSAPVLSSADQGTVANATRAAVAKLAAAQSRLAVQQAAGNAPAQASATNTAAMRALAQAQSRLLLAATKDESFAADARLSRARTGSGTGDGELSPPQGATADAQEEVASSVRQGVRELQSLIALARTVGSLPLAIQSDAFSIVTAVADPGAPDALDVSSLPLPLAQSQQRLGDGSGAAGAVSGSVSAGRAAAAAAAAAGNVSAVALQILSFGTASRVGATAASIAAANKTAGTGSTRGAEPAEVTTYSTEVRLEDATPGGGGRALGVQGSYDAPVEVSLIMRGDAGARARCRYWDVAAGRWRSEGVIATGYEVISTVFPDGSRGSATVTTCAAVHLTEFAGVAGDAAPTLNVVDPIGDAGLLSSLLDASSWVSLAVIGGLSAVFLLLFLLMVKCDRRDARKLRLSRTVQYLTLGRMVGGAGLVALREKHVAEHARAERCGAFCARCFRCCGDGAVAGRACTERVHRMWRMGRAVWARLRGEHSLLSTVVPAMEDRLSLTRPQRVVVTAATIFTAMAVGAMLLGNEPSNLRQQFVVFVLTTICMLPPGVLLPALFGAANTISSSTYVLSKRPAAAGDDKSASKSGSERACCGCIRGARGRRRFGKVAVVPRAPSPRRGSSGSLGHGAVRHQPLEAELTEMKAQVSPAPSSVGDADRERFPSRQRPGSKTASFRRLTASSARDGAKRQVVGGGARPVSSPGPSEARRPRVPSGADSPPDVRSGPAPDAASVSSDASARRKRLKRPPSQLAWGEDSVKGLSAGPAGSGIAGPTGSGISKAGGSMVRLVPTADGEKQSSGSEIRQPAPSPSSTGAGKSELAKPPPPRPLAKRQSSLGRRRGGAALRERIQEVAEEQARIDGLLGRVSAPPTAAAGDERTWSGGQPRRASALAAGARLAMATGAGRASLSGVARAVLEKERFRLELVGLRLRAEADRVTAGRVFHLAISTGLVAYVAVAVIVAAWVWIDRPVFVEIASWFLRIAAALALVVATDFGARAAGAKEDWRRQFQSTVHAHDVGTAAHIYHIMPRVYGILFMVMLGASVFVWASALLRGDLQAMVTADWASLHGQGRVGALASEEARLACCGVTDVPGVSGFCRAFGNGTAPTNGTAVPVCDSRLAGDAHSIVQGTAAGALVALVLVSCATLVWLRDDVAAVLTDLRRVAKSTLGDGKAFEHLTDEQRATLDAAATRIQVAFRYRRMRVRLARSRELKTWTGLRRARLCMLGAVYSLSVVYILVMVYLNLLYSVKFPREVADAWLLNSIYSLLADVCIQQPVIIVGKTVAILTIS